MRLTLEFNVVPNKCFYLLLCLFFTYNSCRLQIRWIHQDTPVSELLTKWPASEWRLELRVRYLPANLRDLCDGDRVTFHYYYDQVTLYNWTSLYSANSLILFSKTPNDPLLME